MTDTQRPMTAAEIEKHYGWCDGQLRQWRHRGVGPPHFARPTARRYMYLLSTVERWLLSTGNSDKPLGTIRATRVR